MTVLAGARVVTPSGVLDPGWVEIDGARIAAVGRGRPDHGGKDLGGVWIVPGFVDLHVHGGGGHDMASSQADADAAVAFHRTHGTTRTLVSLAAAPVDDLIEQLRWVTELERSGPGPDGHVVGAHLEGPFLASSHCGAQNPDHLRPCDRDILEALLAAGGVRTMTIAPELPGAMDLIAALRAAGAIVAVGHTAATHEDTVAAIDAGATLITHLGNAMPPMTQREPGPIGAALDSGVVCEVINDGVHVHDALVRLAGDDLALVTDAIAAAGAPDGTYGLAGQDVTVRCAVARTATGALAGSTLTMDRAFRRTVVDVGLPVGAAAAAAATTPARVLGLDHRCGAIAAGLDADLVALDDDFSVVAVMAQGRWVR